MQICVVIQLIEKPSIELFRMGSMKNMYLELKYMFNIWGHAARRVYLFEIFVK